MTKTGNDANRPARGWPVDDISGLARRLPEVEPRRYFDAQAQDAYRQSLQKWPVLARLMQLTPLDAAASEAAQEAVQDPVQAAVHGAVQDASQAAAHGFAVGTG